MKTAEMVLGFKTLVRHNNQMQLCESWLDPGSKKKKKHLKPNTSGTIGKTEYVMDIRWYLGITINFLKSDHRV